MQRSKNDRYSITLVGVGEQRGQTLTGKRVQVIGVPGVAEGGSPRARLFSKWPCSVGPLI
jgi:hypothetical protein